MVGQGQAGYLGLGDRGLIAGQMINYPFTNHHRRIHFRYGISPELHLEPCG